MTSRRPLTSLALALAAGLLLLLSASPAAAEKPCWKQLIDDWYDGRIDKSYPARCYQQALDNLPEDVEVYSDLPEDLTRAMQAAISGGGQRPSGGATLVPAQPETGRDAAPRREIPPGADTDEEEEEAVASRGPGDREGPLFQLTPSNADSIPIPILVLAGLALLLLAAAAASFLARRIQARRASAAPSFAPRRRPR